jgi:hypothetical protein
MSNFKFDPAQVRPQVQVVVDSTPAVPTSPRSEAERIDNARAESIARHRANNSSSNQFCLDYDPSYYQDFGNGSYWLAKHISYFAQLIGTRINGTLVQSRTFNTRTGIFEGPGYSLSDLTVAYKLRIKELGISEALLEEYNNKRCSWRESRDFYCLTFEEQMERFRS